MNELVVINSNQVPTFHSEELNQSVRRIRAYSRNIEESSFQIALELKHIKDNELYKEDGYSNIIEFSSKVFGYQKTKTYYLLTMAENLLVIHGEEIRTIFARDNQDFSVNQLREMVTLDIGTIEELVKSEEITPNMTVKQIRSAVKKEKSGKKENTSLNQIPDIGKEENTGIKSDNEPIIESETTTESVSSSSLSLVNLSGTSSSEIPSENAQNASESMEISSVVSDYHSLSIDPAELLSRAIIDNYLGEEEEDYPLTPYEFRFYNCKKEYSETKAIDQIELSELVGDSIRLPKELKEYISLLNKEIKRLNHFRTIESKQLDELTEENRRLKEDNSRLQEENDRLVHPVKRGRGRPRKNRD